MRTSTLALPLAIALLMAGCTTTGGKDMLAADAPRALPESGPVGVHWNDPATFTELRHSFIASLLGIRQFIVAVNKMDLVNFDEKVFNSIKTEYLGFAAGLPKIDIKVVPISALDGDNLVTKSEQMPWYAGEPL